MDKIKVIFENEDFIVLEKPEGIVVNKSDTQSARTLQDYIVEKMINFDEFSSDTEFYARSGLVHRLDKDTSGILLIAKNPVSFQKLQEKFKTREVEKKYLCLVAGEVADERFEIDAPIARNPNNRFKYAVVRDGKEAQTYFERIGETEIESHKFTMLYAFPRTGRTHQIRVHLAANGTPIVSDPIYMSEKDQIILEELGIKRLFLHAKSLKFEYNDEKYFFESETPQEFNKFLN